MPYVIEACEMENGYKKIQKMPYHSSYWDYLWKF